MKDIFYSKDITKIDEISQTLYKQPAIILMEQAGLKAWLYMRDNLERDDKIVVFCGGGNNGGDALVVARCAFNDGFENIKIVYCSSKFSSSTTIQKEVVESYKIESIYFEDNLDQVKSIICDSDIIIDGITAIGLKNKLRDNIINIVNLINLTKATKYSIDVPSGLSDTICDISIIADYTFCMGPLKAVYYHPENIGKCNTIIEINPSFPPGVIQSFKPFALLDDKRQLRVKPLGKTDYKKTRGHLAIFGGSTKYSGAVRLSSRGAFSCRCGLVSAFCDDEIYSIVATESPSIIVNKLDSKLNLSSYNAILAGVGWGLGREDLLLEILSFNKPTVLDADGIRAYATLYKNNKINVKDNNNLIFTPHIGELKVLADAVLIDYSLDNTRDFFDTLNKLSLKLNATIVCKASITYIATPGELITIIYNLNPSIGVAGSGDVLAGCIAAFLSYGLTTSQSAREGVIVHLNAGIMANIELGYYSSEKLTDFIGKQLL
jgi:NAD(P)H-hydrate epimerase